MKRSRNGDRQAAVIVGNKTSVARIASQDSPSIHKGFLNLGRRRRLDLLRHRSHFSDLVLLRRLINILGIGFLLGWLRRFRDLFFARRLLRGRLSWLGRWCRFRFDGRERRDGWFDYGERS